MVRISSRSGCLCCRSPTLIPSPDHHHLEAYKYQTTQEHSRKIKSVSPSSSLLSSYPILSSTQRDLRESQTMHGRYLFPSVPIRPNNRNRPWVTSSSSRSVHKSTISQSTKRIVSCHANQAAFVLTLLYLHWAKKVLYSCMSTALHFYSPIKAIVALVPQSKNIAFSLSSSSQASTRSINARTYNQLPPQNYSSPSSSTLVSRKLFCATIIIVAWELIKWIFTVLIFRVRMQHV